MRNFKTKLGLLAAAVLAVCVISFGCSINLSLSNSTGTMKGSFSSAKTNTQTHEINLKKGETVSFKYDFKVKEGEIYAELESPSGKAATHFSPEDSGSSEYTSDENGVYKLSIVMNEAKGSYSIQWKIT